MEERLSECLKRSRDEIMEKAPETKSMKKLRGYMDKQVDKCSIDKKTDDGEPCEDCKEPVAAGMLIEILEESENEPVGVDVEEMTDKLFNEEISVKEAIKTLKKGYDGLAEEELVGVVEEFMESDAE